MSFIDSAVKLYHKREREQIDRFFTAFKELKENGTYQSFENTNADKIWTWACHRWKEFPKREYDLRN